MDLERDLRRARQQQVKTTLGGAVVVSIALFICYNVATISSSDEAVLGKRFVEAVGDGKLAAARALLSRRRQAELTREKLGAALPAEMEGASGFDVNGYEGDGDSRCVEGDLEYPPGTEEPEHRFISFKLVYERGSGDEKTLRIDDWQQSQCNNYWYRE